MMHSILFRLIVSFFMMNVLIWSFVLITDDYLETKVATERNSISRETMYVQSLVGDIVRDPTITKFEKFYTVNRALERLSIPKGALLNVYVYEMPMPLSSSDRIFGERDYLDAPALTASKIINNDTQLSVTKQSTSLIESIITYLSRWQTSGVVTSQIEADFIEHTEQNEVLKTDKGELKIRTVAPIQEAGETVGFIELSRYFDVEELLANRYKRTLLTLSGVTSLTLFYALYLALNTALPLRRLSKLMRVKSSGHDLTEDLRFISSDKLKYRKDEIGSLHNSLSTMLRQVSDLYEKNYHFSQDIAHELKNPIAGIIAKCEALETGNAKKNEDLQFLKSLAKRMSALVTQISEAALVEADLVSGLRKKIDVSELTNGLLDYFQAECDERKITLQRDIRDNIFMTGSEDRFGQVLVNLIENALSFTPEGGMVKVSLSSSQLNKKLSITVEDSGTGIPEANRQKVFDRFFSMRDNQKSSGLGLYISKKIIDAHKGDISVEQSDMGGAKFIIKLPKK